ncbi:MAG: YceI family protein [Alphaproteobacteria bacterium]|nr:YceI family protein [Alphaproteobacteria bacterium]
MKKYYFQIFMFVLALGIQNGLSAQQILATKTAQISFDASGGVETIAAVNNQADLKLLPSNGQIVVAVLNNGFVFENALMGDHFNENYIESTKFPKSIFKGFIKNMAAVDLTKNGSYPIEVNGELTMHGVSQNVQCHGTFDVKDNKYALKGSFTIKLKDYKIGGKYVGDKIASEVKISISGQLN